MTPEEFSDATSGPVERISFRDVTADDFAWVRELHRVIYLDQLGWPPSFMATVDALLDTLFPRLLAAQHDPRRNERGWIAMHDGEPVGAIFVVNHRASTAKLRMLVVNDAARGLGIGTALIARVIAFARECDYARIDLWTESTLSAARRLYAAAGFRIVDETPSEIVRGATAETWRLDFTPGVSTGSNVIGPA